MSDTDSQNERRRRFLQLLAFPLGVGLVYGVIALAHPDRALDALQVSWQVLLQIAPALLIAFGMIVALNLLVRPAQIKRFLGRGTEIKGSLLSVVAGILSMGPIYAWYPLLGTLREKDVSSFHLSTFLGCRAVKIPLLPIMAAYFGWVFTITISLVMILGSLGTGAVVQLFDRPAAASE